ncbi:hypothetical protein C343_04432 [Cryptococcus neoformans C23]|uniref:Uncharacterized protein n=2 Tax=Cryptococcus neoformans TaxID=5207 RepID=A0A854QG01_CRYNE|nr:hypothetical protein CNAG_07993 [Cryptococcus neoformans var. grubii H99]AUB26219.1 hypothetical protein CKF44_07993 [Cryptococcus neoformans var. grubii]OWZ41920.1 hypothetical protein C343_04432 [Cryptococcus neoformans var. grubii C23]OWZ52944.1 hypothetical protein C368_04505 [Cryptococcus neoformans var. grubii 125.91]OXG17652.1 hypothetical protein C361_04639 [Cryptococcus neoformans var. grubii Tu259-1]OXG29957.1 hypothetical protein C360_05163 [Cryptococcus neoformans var. grubii Bt|eukprot:XP_012051401.1 hypothetical protein CNAG_07993 [Cryptococcus neoformans var. grubii H99]
MPASTSTIRSYMSERIQNRINPRPLTKEESRASFDERLVPFPNSQDNMICPTKYPLRRSTIPLPSQRSSIPKSSYLLFQALFGIRYSVTLLQEINAAS